MTNFACMKQAVLILETGQTYRGIGFGASGASYGELVFNTSMTGYVESLTDPSYAGQILIFSYPLIGNYGVSSTWFESEQVHPVGVVVHEFCTHPYHRQSEVDLNSFLTRFGKLGIAGVDTRALVKLIRQTGTLPAVLLVGEEDESLNTAITFEAALAKVNNRDEVGFWDWPSKVARKTVEYFVWRQTQLVQISETELGSLANLKRVGILDYGVKANIIREVAKRGALAVVLPPTITFTELLAYNLSGLVISNGPGDPRDYKTAHHLLQQVLDYVFTTNLNFPVFGICLGHQLLAQVIGANIYKMTFGNRGVNQPVLNMLTKNSFLTSQNHSYAVDLSTLPTGWQPWFINLNDQSAEGLRHTSKPIFSVQFHPEACGGPQDTNWLFEEFFKFTS